MTHGNKISGELCPICSGSSTLAPEDREYIRCTTCGALRTRYTYNPKMYGEGYAQTYIAYARNGVNTPLNLFRLGLVSRWLQQGDKLLDVGCCVGEFVRFAERYYDCIGFEPNSSAATIARRQCNSPISSHLTGHGTVNCVTMFDVLEHIEKPYEFLEVIHRMLGLNGFIALTTPNVDVIAGWNDQGLRQWKHYKPGEHLFLYTEKSLETLFEKSGFNIIHFGREESDIRPGNPNGDILTCVARRV